MIDNLQRLKRKTKLKFYQNLGDYCDETKYKTRIGYFQFDGDVLSKSA